MELNEIIAAVVALPPAERNAVVSAAISADTERQWKEKAAADIVAACEQAYGSPLSDYGRNDTQTALRAVVSYRLRYEAKMKLTEIADRIHRNHATVIFYIKRMEAALDLPTMWPEYIELYNKSKIL